MNVIKRNGESYAFDISKVVDAVSKAAIRKEAKKVEKKCRMIELFTGVGDCSEDSEFARQLAEEILNREIEISVIVDDYSLQLEIEKLKKRREQLRVLRRLKTAQVSQMIRTAWMNRNYTAGRSNTGAVTDPMLLSIPTPPTSEAANRSLRCGGNMIAYI